MRAELVREITDIARSHLADEGASGLSLRAIAREMGMVSSAIHRYFATKDDLLTALIMDGYNAAGATLESADAACSPGDYPGRWLAVCHALRSWALANPHEYALIYGSPVPGYRAPEDTIVPAGRSTTVYGRILADAHEAGRLVPPDTMGPPVPAILSEDAQAVRSVMPGVSDDLVSRAIIAWTGLYGMISFELFGQFNNVITHRTEFFDHNMRALAAFLGLR
ncbi:TetR family transcriptional regulator [Acrocarpospora phusangensis]|uniref:TetR family transcriptional regulator n=1 Tax=Acrocarpospora phusangensis TaxID=1070424 RepID=A0A919USI5_9ACTN|nr:TetR/AcrR family transcriptional regulator [Acrocarpospora phusangensis]GIH29252.1 TetR family transcriptional regulator [Acrocarpospora phusangensis]